MASVLEIVSIVAALIFIISCSFFLRGSSFFLWGGLVPPSWASLMNEPSRTLLKKVVWASGIIAVASLIIQIIN
jgi:uncharacterized membrane protein